MSDFEPELKTRLIQAENTIIPVPFAAENEQRSPFAEKYQPDAVNFATGFPVASQIPPMSGGMSVKRNDFNELGYEATLGGFMWQIGYKPTFSQTVCDKIGGYPKGAILTDYSLLDEDNTADQGVFNMGDFAIVRDVISLKDNNTKNFVKSADNPTPYEIGSADENGDVWWDYVDRTENSSIHAPDYSTLVHMATKHCVGSDLITWTSDINGWILLVAEREQTEEWIPRGDTTWPTRIVQRGTDGKLATYDLLVDPRVPYPKANGTASTPSKVYYEGFGEWSGGQGSISGEKWLVYSSDEGPKVQRVFPTNVGQSHSIRIVVKDAANALRVRLFALGEFETPSELEMAESEEEA